MMYIHLGGEKVISSKELIAIFDISNERPADEPKMFLTHDSQEKMVEKIGEEDAKSLVITENKLYYSPISTATLKKRATNLSS